MTGQVTSPRETFLASTTCEGLVLGFAVGLGGLGRAGRALGDDRMILVLGCAWIAAVGIGLGHYLQLPVRIAWSRCHALYAVQLMGWRAGVRCLS
jgi:hypothetical protein